MKEALELGVLKFTPRMLSMGPENGSKFLVCVAVSGQQGGVEHLPRISDLPGGWIQVPPAPLLEVPS